jgi:hypothetical protein
MTKLSSALSIRKGANSNMSSSGKKHSPTSSVDSSLASFVHIERPVPVAVKPAVVGRVGSRETVHPEVKIVEATFVQLPTIHVEERHNSLTAQWAGFLEESDRREKNRSSVICEEV